MTMEQVVTQLQQELFTLRAQVAAESGLADAVRALNISHSSSSERHPESHRCERPWLLEGVLWQKGGFRQLSKKTEAFFAGVIKESEMMLEWAAEQATEITTTALDLEFLPTDTNVDRGVQNLEFVPADAYSAHGSH